jgi:hypothetical protein
MLSRADALAMLRTLCRAQARVAEAMASEEVQRQIQERLKAERSKLEDKVMHRASSRLLWPMSGCMTVVLCCAVLQVISY